MLMPEKKDLIALCIINFMSDMLRLIEMFLIISGGSLLLALSEGWKPDSLYDFLSNTKQLYVYAVVFYIIALIIKAIVFDIILPFTEYITSGAAAICSFYVILSYAGRIDARLLFSLLLVLYTGKQLGYILLRSQKKYTIS